MRRLRPHVPRDLEAICLKCLSKRPDDRYATAHDLVKDLERFLTGQPTKARPLRTIERVAKWARRRPALAGLSAALAVTIAASVAVVAVLMIRLDSELEASQRKTLQLRHQVYNQDVKLASDAYNSFDLDTARKLLAAHAPDIDGDLDVGDWAHSMLDGLTHTCTDEWPARGPVLSVAISPDSQLVASAEEGSYLVVPRASDRHNRPLDSNRTKRYQFSCLFA